MYKSKFTILAVLLLLMATVLVACGGPAAEPTQAPQATEEMMEEHPTEEVMEEKPTEEVMEEKPTEEVVEEKPTEEVVMEPCAPTAEGALAGVDPRGQSITFWHNHSRTREEGLLAIVEAFNTTNECGITLVAENQGSYDDIRNKVNASVSSGELPAALVVGYQNDQAFYQLNDSLADLNTYMNDSHWGLTAEEQADFYPAFLNQSVHALFDNQRLGFPPNRSIEVMYYNQTWLAELGFDAPPTNPDDFKAMSCAAAAAVGDGTGGYVLRDDASAVAAWTYAFGGDVLNEDGASYNYNNEATAAALTFLKGMLDEGCAYFLAEGFPDPQFAARKAIFTQGSSSGMPFYYEGVTTVATEAGRDPDAWGIMAIPHTTAEPVVNVYGGDVMITATAPEQELAAWVFIKYFTSPEVQAQWDQISGYFPTRASTAQYLQEYVSGSPYGAQFQQALDLVQYGTYEPQLISYTAVRDAVTAAFNEIMQGADVQTTLDALTEEANALQEELMAETE